MKAQKKAEPQLEVRMIANEGAVKAFFYMDGVKCDGLVELQFPSETGANAKARIHYTDTFIVTENVVIAYHPE